jgi:hypothetical protein
LLLYALHDWLIVIGEVEREKEEEEGRLKGRSWRGEKYKEERAERRRVKERGVGEGKE